MCIYGRYTIYKILMPACSEHIIIICSISIYKLELKAIRCWYYTHHRHTKFIAGQIQGKRGNITFMQRL